MLTIELGAPSAEGAQSNHWAFANKMQLRSYGWGEGVALWEHLDVSARMLLLQRELLPAIGIRAGKTEDLQLPGCSSGWHL